MVKLRPFRGWRYNTDVVDDLASVICPPYDIIDRDLEESLRLRSPYNAVFLEGAERPDWNAAAADRYAQAAGLFQDWRQREVLRRDAQPTFYLMEHTYSFQGRDLSRTGLICCVGLEDYQTRGVLAHELTQEPAVQDRVALMDSCNANFSPIMSLYRDPSGALSQLYHRTMAEAQPIFRVRDDSGHGMALWCVTGQADQDAITARFANISVFLADGHHRYEAALRLKGQRQSSNDAGEDQAQDFVMMTLFDFDDPGVLVLPYHRVVGGLNATQLDQIRSRLNRIFDVEEVGSGAEGVEDLLQTIAGAAAEKKTVGVAGLAEPGLHLLTLKPDQEWQNWGPLAVSEGWILEEQVLKPVLGEATPQHVDYIHDHDLALAQVASGEQQLALLLRPFPMDGFESVVGAGHLLPRKSTFFYPKLPTGLVINQLDGAL